MGKTQKQRNSKLLVRVRRGFYYLSDGFICFNYEYSGEILGSILMIKHEFSLKSEGQV